MIVFTYICTSLTKICVQGPEKKVRGRSRGINADKVYEQLGTKIPVTLTKHNGRLTGPYAEIFTNEIGFTVRNYAPMNVKQWKEIKPNDVDKLIKRIIVSDILLSGNFCLFCSVKL